MSMHDRLERRARLIGRSFLLLALIERPIALVSDGESGIDLLKRIKVWQSRIHLGRSCSSARVSARMCSGPAPQHPPMKSAPTLTISMQAEANSFGVSISPSGIPADGLAQIGALVAECILAIFSAYPSAP